MTNYFASQGSLARGDIFVDEAGTIYTVVEPLKKTGEMTLIKGSISNVDRSDYAATKSAIEEISGAEDFDVLVLHRRTPSATRGY
jgi:hypothetical protein